MRRAAARQEADSPRKRSVAVPIALVSAIAVIGVVAVIVAVADNARQRSQAQQAVAYATRLVQNAQTAGAAQYAPNEYQSASRALSVAQLEMQRGKWKDATAQANQASKSANIAANVVQKLLSDFSRQVASVQAQIDSAQQLLGDDPEGGGVGQARNYLNQARQYSSASNLASARTALSSATAALRQALREHEAAVEAESSRAQAARRQAEANPLSMTELRFNNTYKNGSSISGYKTSFTHSEVRYIAGHFRVKNNLYHIRDQYVTFNFRIQGPGGMKSGTGSSSGYTGSGLSATIGKSDSYYSGWMSFGSESGGTYSAGTYTYSLYANGRFLGSRKFSIYVVN